VILGAGGRYDFPPARVNPLLVPPCGNGSALHQGRSLKAMIRLPRRTAFLAPSRPWPDPYSPAALSTATSAAPASVTARHVPDAPAARALPQPPDAAEARLQGRH